MSDLDLLATFLEIYRRGSLTAAAAALGVSQPAVSGQLARLEGQLDAVLFERSRHGATPTPRAHELARHIAAPWTSCVAPWPRTPTVRPIRARSGSVRRRS
ncbi:LysR family transcriptional regulator [Streptomyces nogalater]